MSKELKKTIESFKKYIDNLEKQQNYLYDMEDYYKDDIEQNELLLKMLHSVLNYIENSIPKEKVEEKIKENNKLIEECREDEEHCGEIYLYEHDNNILQELLEEK